MFGGNLLVSRCVLRRIQAEVGAAVLVLGGFVRFEETNVTDNIATAGGGLQVDGGTVVLANKTRVVGNSAQTGRTVNYLTGSLKYELPAPLGHWVFIDDGGTMAVLSPGALDLDYPYACSAGVYGDSYIPSAQSNPICTGPYAP